MSNLNFDDLKNQVCVITGGAGVIGSAMAEGLAAAGIKMAILDINEEKVLQVASEIAYTSGGIVKGYKANVLDEKSMQRVKEQINSDLGPITLLINGAGGNHPKATTEYEMLEKDHIDKLEGSFYGLDLEGFDFVFDLNFKGTLISTRALTGDMLKIGKGAVVNISSMNAYRPLTKIPAYSAAKASVNNFTQWLAVHLAQTGIRVNAIAPGFFSTNQNKFLLYDEKTGELTKRGRKIIESTPMGRYGEVDELVGTILYLLSDVSKFVTGISIPVDGGYSAYGGV